MCAGTPTNGGVRRDIREDHGARAHARVLAHRHIAEDIGVVADKNVVADGGVTLAMLLARAASVTPWYMVTSLPTMAVSPITTPWRDQ